MNWMHVIDVLLVVLCVAVYAARTYQQVKGNVVAAIAKLIAAAEDTGLAGEEKMDLVVSWLYDLVPPVWRKILTKEKLEQLAQDMFDWMRQYADAYASAAATAATEQEREDLTVSAATDITLDAAAEILDELLTMTVARLKEKAEEYGVNIDGKQSKSEIIKELFLAILNKA